MKENTVFTTKSSAETKKTGKILAKKVLRMLPASSAFCVALSGGLGGGKTTFLQGFASGLGIREKILSPTFVIYKKISSKGAGFNNFYHFDCYRLKGEKEVFNLGFKKIISNPKNIVAIEWAEKIKGALPENTLFLKFEFLGPLKRKIHVNPRKK